MIRAEMLARMSSAELSGWRELYRVEAEEKKPAEQEAQSAEN